MAREAAHKDAAQRKEKQVWAIEKPKLDNARRLRGIHFIDPDDVEFKETIERKKLFSASGSSYALKKSGGTSARKLAAGLMLGDQSMHAPWNANESVGMRLEGNSTKRS